MAFVFIEQSNKKRYVVLALLAVLVGGGGFAWYIYDGRDISSPIIDLIVRPSKTLRIDLDALMHPVFDELGELRAPIPFPEDVGRINPFIPVEAENEKIPES